MPKVRLLALLCVTMSCGDQVVGQFGGGIAGSGTATADASGGSEGTPTAEVCDGIDNDLDGLTDEVAPGNNTCDRCTLLEGKDQVWWACDDMLVWEAAQTRCESYGADLAIIPDDVTQTFLHEALGTSWWWLGARQDETEGEFLWVDGSPLIYSNWGTTQPDDTAPGQDCLRLTFGITDAGWFDGAWDDYDCELNHQFLCSAPGVAD